MSSTKLQGFVTALGIDLLAAGKRIERMRGDSTLAEFAKLCGWSDVSQLRYERGEIPSIEIVEKIARVVGTTASDILGVKMDHYDRQNTAETPSSYRRPVSRADLNVIRELKELLAHADDDIKRHLRNQIRLLKRAASNPPGDDLPGGEEDE